MKKPWYISMWKEGKLLDWWTVIHIIDGMFLAGISILLGFSFYLGFLITLAILLIWEIIEPPETAANKIVDVITSILGFFIYISLKSQALFIIVTTLAISLNFWAWILTKNYKKF